MSKRAFLGFSSLYIPDDDPLKLSLGDYENAQRAFLGLVLEVPYSDQTAGAPRARSLSGAQLGSRFIQGLGFGV